jgi:EmrB/QacA subfamily drug resistance transporter
MSLDVSLHSHPTTPGTLAPPPQAQRWVALAFIALAQLMVALDATIVNIAMPSAQAALHFSDAERQWVITAYTLAFGGLLLLGGRIADSIGRKRAFLIGVAGFAVASALSGASTNLGTLASTRALQGVFGALLAPTALSLLAVTFTEPHDRARAFGVYGAIAGGGAALGLVLGGLLAQYLDWRWCLYVNVPIALIAAVGAWTVLHDTPPRRGNDRGRGPGSGLDVAGALLGTGGLVALVFGCGQAAARGWDALTVLAPLTTGAIALVLFVVREARVANPLLPLHIVVDRRRGAAYLSVVLAVAGMFGAFLFLTYDLQVVLRFSPFQAGVAFLPYSAGALLSSGGIATRLLPRVSPRTLMVPAFLAAAAGMATDAAHRY